MDKDQLTKLALDFLVPLIPGATLDSMPIKVTQASALVARLKPGVIAFKAGKDDTFRCVLRRTQPFENQNSRQMTEFHVVEAFVKVVNSMKSGLQTKYGTDLRAAFPRRVVAKALCTVEERRVAVSEAAMLAAIDQLVSWSRQQYEGRPIPAALGFEPGDSGEICALGDFCATKFSSVLSNGYDTLIVCSNAGKVKNLVPISQTQASTGVLAPVRLAGLANWATDGRIALTLNRNGEILIFRDGQLRFVLRGSQWHFLTHKPVITQMQIPFSRAVRTALHETALDVSFARTGACIGVVADRPSIDWRTVAVEKDDYLNEPSSVKARVCAAIVAGQPFHKLDRRLRAEIAAIDGALILDAQGVVLAVGAILRIAGGSTDGGRTAAAKAASALGLGIKVSADGPIQIWRTGETNPIVSLM